MDEKLGRSEEFKTGGKGRWKLKYESEEIDVIDILSCINGGKMSISNSFLHRRLIDAVLTSRYEKGITPRYYYLLHTKGQVHCTLLHFNTNRHTAMLTSFLDASRF